MGSAARRNALLKTDLWYDIQYHLFDGGADVRGECRECGDYTMLCQSCKCCEDCCECEDKEGEESDLERDRRYQ